MDDDDVPSPIVETAAAPAVVAAPSAAAQTAAWSTGEVLVWVSGLPGLTEKEIQTFATNEVDGEDLLALDKSSLRDDLGGAQLYAVLYFQPLFYTGCVTELTINTATFCSHKAEVSHHNYP